MVSSQGIFGGETLRKSRNSCDLASSSSLHFVDTKLFEGFFHDVPNLLHLAVMEGVTAYHPKTNGGIPRGARLISAR